VTPASFATSVRALARRAKLDVLGALVVLGALFGPARLAWGADAGAPPPSPASAAPLGQPASATPAPATAAPATAAPAVPTQAPVAAPAGSVAPKASASEVAAPPAASAAPAAPAPAASATPAAPAASVDATPAKATDEGPFVKLHDEKVFSIRLDRGGLTAEARARAASQALERAASGKEALDVRVVDEAGLAVIYAGQTPIVQLSELDAKAAGDASLAVHASNVASKVREALKTERQRSQLAKTVLNISIVVLSALAAFLVLRKLGQLADRTTAWLESSGSRINGLTLRGIELVSGPALRGSLLVAVAAGKRVAQFGIAYGWLLVVLSLFDATRAYSERLTGLVLTPLTGLVGRIGAALPALVVLAIALAALGLLLRFAGLFFQSVESGETELGWLPADLARPTSIVVRVGVVVAAILFVAPLITGSDDAVSARAGLAILLALALATTPVLASAAVGLYVVYGRRLRVGDRVALGERIGTVQRLTLLEAVIDEEPGGVVTRVPHLLGLVSALRLVGDAPTRALELDVSPEADLERALALLVELSSAADPRAEVELVRADRDAASFVVRTSLRQAERRSALLASIVGTLQKSGIALGRRLNG
jgi:small-conductance mechanosensitive channel